MIVRDGIRVDEHTVAYAIKELRDGIVGVGDDEEADNLISHLDVLEKFQRGVEPVNVEHVIDAIEASQTWSSPEV